MEQRITPTGIATPLLRDDIDTDLLGPSWGMTSTTRDGYGEKLLAHWRHLPSKAGRRVENPDFLLNQPAFRRASILIAEHHFGSGASREVAVWAVRRASSGRVDRFNCAYLRLALAR